MRILSKRTVLHIIGLWLAIQSSYLHPDEHFQSLEILCERFYNYKGVTPWEFDPEHAARSFVPLYVFYGPLLYIVKYLLKVRMVTQASTIVMLVRLQGYLLYMIVVKITLNIISVRSFSSPALAELFIMTSYITCSYQSHSFSNSNETILLLFVLALYKRLLIKKQNETKNFYLESVILGALIVLGIFNRITFAGFILLPSLDVFMKFYCSHWKSFYALISSVVVCLCGTIILDTRLYQSSVYIIAPLNNLLYNLDQSNLALHGIHPRFTHLLVNLPQILGPGMLLLPQAFSFYSEIWKDQIVLSVISGLAFLSLFKHQELRFIVPLAPLIFCCFAPNTGFGAHRWKHVYRLWLAFNLVMALIMCTLHQAGILPAINYYSQNGTQIGVHIFWKTYSPPTWMYMNANLTVSTTNFVENVESLDEVPFNITHNHVVDLRGSDIDILTRCLEEFHKHSAIVTLVAPNSVRRHLNYIQEGTRYELTKHAEWRAHLDLDHIDPSDLSTLSLGLVSYDVSLL